MAHAGGRPSTYTKAIADAICERIAEGQSMTSICQLPGMPMYKTIMHWRRTEPEFGKAIDQAREDQADALAEMIVDVVEEGAKEDELGKVDAGMVAHNRLKVDVYKWRASKLKPKVYGDKVQQEHSGPDGGPIYLRTGVPRSEPPK
jgi:hypothetical protein